MFNHLMVLSFWASLAIVFYSYIGYPILICLISLIYTKEPMLQQTESHPYASLLISAYNEQTFIEDKILNSLQLNYPKTQLEVMVVSDGSDDRTDEIVRSYERQGIVLQRFEGRIGKTACLNKAVSLARGEIIIFSDANAQYDQNAVKELTKHFSDSKIGFVTGHTKYIGEQNDKVKQSVGIYSKLERFAKNSESKIGSCVGADGAIFAIRKILYKELSSQDINDLVIPFHILKQGFRGILEQRAFCFEKAPKGISAEFSRQVRIANRTIRAILNNFQLANPFHYGLFAWQLLSHKLLKLLVPFFLLILLMTSLFLSSDKPFYFLVFMGQIITYLLALIGFVQYKLLKSSKLTSIATTFTVANLAILTGWMTYLRGDKNITWKVSR